jgi:hypothetical protein
MNDLLVILRKKKRSNKFLLRDEFTDTVAGGAVNATLATPFGGARTAVDTNLKISVGSGVLNFATGEVANDGVWWPIRTRTAGRVLLTKITPANTTGAPALGWDTNQAGQIRNYMRFRDTGAILACCFGGASVSVAVYSATAYQIGMVMRGTGIHYFIKGGAFTNWTYLYGSLLESDNLYPAIQAQNIASIFTADFVRVPEKLVTIYPLASDGFTRANGALGSSGGAGSEETGGDGLAWTGATFTISTNKAINTPTQSVEKFTDGGLETWTSATDLTNWTEEVNGTSTVNREGTVKHGGNFAARMDIDALSSVASIKQSVASSVGDWVLIDWWGYASAAGVKPYVFNNTGIAGATRNPGSNWVNYKDVIRQKVLNGDYVFTRYSASSASVYFDDISAKVLTLASLFASLQVTTANVLAEVAVTIGEVGTQAGLVLNLDSAAAPANFVIAYHDGVNAKLDKCVAGVYTQMISSAATYAAGARLVVSKSGDKYRLFYNDVLVGAEQTIADAGIVSNKLHGLFSTYASNSLDNFVVWAKGNGGEYDGYFDKLAG